MIDCGTILLGFVYIDSIYQLSTGHHRPQSHQVHILYRIRNSCFKANVYNLFPLPKSLLLLPEFTQNIASGKNQILLNTYLSNLHVLKVGNLFLFFSNKSCPTGLVGVFLFVKVKSTLILKIGTSGLANTIISLANSSVITLIHISGIFANIDLVQVKEIFRVVFPDLN